MKKLALAISILAISAVSASAADMAPAPRAYSKAPPPIVAPIYNWTGFYVGINGGGGWGTSRFDFVNVATTTGNYNVSGGLVGGTAGYNWQSGQFVFGLEGDIDWSGLRGTNGNRPTGGAGGFVCNGPIAAGGTGFACGTDNTWLGTVRGRVGLAVNNVLFFGTGGVAFGDVRARLASDPGFPLFGGQTDTRVGWTAGAGIEYAFLGSWSAKLEYLYADLGKMSCDAVTCGGAVTDVSFKTSIVRVGVNYRFW
jgi:outer membrane immunogenic protein